MCLVDPVVYRFSGMHIGTNDIEFHGTFLKRFFVERIDVLRQCVIAVLSIIQVTCFQPGTETAVCRIL
jgi:hypothetical protein